MYNVQHIHHIFFYLLQLLIIIVVVPNPTDQKKSTASLSEFRTLIQRIETNDEKCEAENRIQKKKHSLCSEQHCERPYEEEEVETTYVPRFFHSNAYDSIVRHRIIQSYVLKNLRAATISDVILISARIQVHSMYTQHTT